MVAVMGETIRRRGLCPTRCFTWLFCCGLLLCACEAQPEPLPIRRFRPTSAGPLQVEAKLGPVGGTLTLPSGASAQVPEAALEREVWLSIRARTLDTLTPLPEGSEALTRTYVFLPVAQRFERPVNLQIAYPDLREKAELEVLRLDDARDGRWERVADATTTVGVARISTERFGIYVVVRRSVREDAGVGD